VGKIQMPLLGNLRLALTIPAILFFEPNWESGKNEWWTFKRTDGQPWALAGLWNTWIDKDSGE
jgi:putative SOS response-associated peptidase YedK